MQIIKHLLWFLIFSSSAIGQSSYSEFNSRGLIRSLYTEPGYVEQQRFQLWLSLKGASERASCPTVFFNINDTQGPEIARLAMQLNRPVEIKFLIAAGNEENRNKSESHCEIVQIQLKV